MTLGKHVGQHLLPNEHSVTVTTVPIVSVAITTTSPQMLMFIPDCVLSHRDEDNIYILRCLFQYKLYLQISRRACTEPVTSNTMDGSGEKRTGLIHSFTAYRLGDLR